MHTPSSLIASITLIAFIQAQTASLWALPAVIPEQAHTPTLMYLGNDPYTQALLRLQYNEINNTLKWQLLNNGLVLTSQSHALPETTESVDAAVIYGGDLITVAGRSSNQNWFLRALNSQGGFQWQRSGEGRVYDLAFSGDGKALYAVGRSVSAPLFMVVDAESGVVLFHADGSNNDRDLVYRQLAVTGDKELVFAASRDTDGFLDFIKWQARVDGVTGSLHWNRVDTFCGTCKKMGINAVALNRSQGQPYFFAITAHKNGLTFELKDSTHGRTINSKSIRPENGYAGHWHQVLKVNIGQGLTGQVREYEKHDIWLTNSQLLLTSHECLIGARFHNLASSYLVNLCQPSTFATHRKLQQAKDVENRKNVTTPGTTEDDTLQKILTGIGVTSILGIFGTITLIAGFVSVMCSQWSKHKENINNALDKEKQRRQKEGGILKSLPGTKPFIPFDSGGSVFELAVPPLPIIASDGQEYVEINALNHAKNSPTHLAAMNSGLNLLDIMIEDDANKSLYDRKTDKPQTPAPDQSPVSSFQGPKVKQQTPSPNLPVIREAKVQWRRYIHDDDVRATMESYDQFFAKNITHHPKDIPEEAYRQFREVIKGNVPIDLVTPDGLITIKLKKEFGKGGSKLFYDIGDGQALAIIVAPHQPYDELMMFRYLEKLGIPTNEIIPAVIRWEFQGVKYSRATYIAPSFDSYAKQNAFVLDSKNVYEVADRLNGKKVLSEGQDPFRLENWDEVLNPLVQDVRTLIDNGVSTLGDSLNAILAGKGTKFHSGGHTDYEVRAFPFDFSSKYYQYDQLPVKKQLSVEEERRTLRAYIKQAAFVQFDVSAKGLPKEWSEFIDRLAERYLRRNSGQP